MSRPASRLFCVENASVADNSVTLRKKREKGVPAVRRRPASQLFLEEDASVVDDSVAPLEEEEERAGMDRR